jgi:histidinol-phosphate aminotransferase
MQSPSKFYGIAGVRTGVVWTRNESLRRRLAEMQDTWPISLPDAKVAAAAMRDDGWAAESRVRLLEDARWLEARLADQLTAIPGTAHFRFGFSADAEGLRRAFLNRGIVVRALGTAHGVIPGGVRVSPPKLAERQRLLAALRDILPA